MNDVVLFVMGNIIPILVGVVLVMILWVVAWSFASRKKKASMIPAEIVLREDPPRRRIVEKKRYAESVQQEVEEDSLKMKALLTMCMGDRDKAERLVQFEMGKNPGGNREDWIDEAIKRWGRDLHRL